MRVRSPTQGGSGKPPAGISGSRRVVVVGMGQMLANNDPTVTLVTYSLGSCLGVVVYDPMVRVGGLLHAMLPEASINPARAEARPSMFVDTGLSQLFHAMYELGAAKRRMIVKLAGGAQFLDRNQFFNIGARNIDMALSILTQNGVQPVAIDCGGHECRTVRLEIATGKVAVDKPGAPRRFL